MIAPGKSESQQGTQPIISCVTGVFAACILKGTENGVSRKRAFDAVLNIQTRMRAICPQCGEVWRVTPISRSYARRVCNLARTVSLHELMQELERHLNGHVPRCPRCGHSGDARGCETVR